MKNLFLLFYFLFFTIEIISGQCTCTNCPLPVPDNTTVTSDIIVSGLSNPTLGVGGQDVCEIKLHFVSDAVEEIRVTLTSPSGDQVQLIVPGTIGFDDNIEFNISFVRCSDVAVPDPGFSAIFDPEEAWQNNTTYTGSYYPSSGCLEDFSGNANGTWTLTLEDIFILQPQELLGWEIIFCDGTGTTCGLLSTCLAEGGEFHPESPITACFADPILNLGLSVDYGANSSNDPSIYGYKWIISDNNGTGNVIDIVDNPDLTSYIAGQYTICGFSYLLTDLALLPVPSATLFLSDILTDIANDLYCADVVTTCADIIIQDDYIDPVVDWGTNTDLCEGVLNTFTITNYDPSLNYTISIISGGLNVFNVNGADINVDAFLGPVELCVFINGDCNPGQDCQIFNVLTNTPVDLSTQADVCPGDVFTISVLPPNNSSTYNWTISGPGTITQDNNDNVVVNVTGAGQVEICAEDTNPICGTSTPVCRQVTVVNVPPPSIFTDPFYCFPGGFLVGNSNGSSTSTVYTQIIAGPGTITFFNPNVVSTQFDADLPGLYTIELTKTFNGCTASTTATFEVLPALDITTSVVCANGEFVVMITFNNGTAPYFVDGTPISGNVYTSQSYPSGTAITILYEDSNGCEGDFFAQETCSCTTDAGTMNLTLIEFCGSTGQATSLFNNNETLDGNDVLYYVLHDGSGTILGNVFDSNLSGDFSFLAGMTLGQTYYISTIAGNPDGGFVDINDPCLSVSIGQPVIWYEIPSVVLPNDFETCEYSVNLSAIITSGADVEWRILGAPTGAIPIINNPNVENVNILFNIPETYFFEVVVDKDNCTSREEIRVDILPEVNIQNLTETCNGSTYIVTFEILGGLPDFEVNGILQSSNIFTSDPIATGDPYNFTVIDANGCSYTGIVGSKNCNCISDAGTMSNNLINLCGDTAQAVSFFNNDAVLDGDDSGLFYIHTGNGVSLGTILDFNTSGIFTFLIGMNLGQTYYISHVVGNSQGQGIDQNDPCLDVALGQPVVWNTPPMINFPDSIILCQDTFYLEANPNNQSVLSGITDVNYPFQWAVIDTLIRIVMNDRGNFSINSIVQEPICETSLDFELIYPERIQVQSFYECNDDGLTFDYRGVISGGYPQYIIASDTLETNEITLSGLSISDTLVINISDLNGCSTSLMIGTMCDCVLPQHEMPIDTLSICDLNTSILVSTLSVGTLNPNEIGTYIIHDRQDDTLGNLFALDYDGIFTFQAPLLLDTYYYISFVSGVKVFDNINLADPCLSVSVGQVIIFRSTPQLSAQEHLEICGVDTVINNIVQGEEVIYLAVGSNSADLSIIRNGDFSSFEASNSGIFQIERIFGLECQNRDTFEILFVDSLGISGLTELCSSDNSEYTISFEISGGISPYFVNGQLVTNDIFVLANLPSGDSYQLVVTGTETCDSVLIEGVVDCSCPSTPADLDDSELLCSGEDASITILRASLLASGYGEEYILHDGTNTQIGTIYGSFLTSVIPFDFSYPLDTDLLLTPVVGPLENGSIDFNDSCYLLGQSANIRWESLSDVEVTVPNTICQESGELVVSFEVQSSNFPITISFLINGLLEQVEVIQNGFDSILFDNIFSDTSIEVDVVSTTCLSSQFPQVITVDVISCDCEENQFSTILKICSDNNMVDLNDWVVNGPEGDWSIQTFPIPNLIMINNDILQVGNEFEGLLTIGFQPQGENACDTLYQFELEIEKVSNLSLSVDTETICSEDGQMINLNVYLIGDELSGQWQPLSNIPLGGLIDGVLNTAVFDAGQYQFEYLIDQGICQTTPLIYTLTIPEIPEYIITSNNPDCFGDSGSIAISLIDPDQIASITLNDQIVTDLDIESLSSGEYTIEITDTDLCQYIEEILIEDPLDLSIDLTGGIFDNEGEQAQANAFVLGGVEPYTYAWSIDGEPFEQENNNTLSINISNDIEVSVTVTDANGCSIEDLIIIRVQGFVPIVLPNVFNPSSSGGNSIFKIPRHPKFQEFKSVKIFDRWGSLLYIGRNIDQGWDGKKDGVLVSQGVYIYLIKFVDQNGIEQQLYGDLLVLR